MQSARDLYSPPAWAGACAGGYALSLETLRGGVPLGAERSLCGDAQGATLLGRAPGCDVEAEHPSVSRCHCVVQQERGTRRAWLWDNGSTHGVTLNRARVPPREFVPLRPGDSFQLGASSRLYILAGPDADGEIGAADGLGHAVRGAPRGATAQAGAAAAAARAAKVAAAKLKQAEAAAEEMRRAIRGGSEDEALESQSDEENGVVDWRCHGGSLNERQQRLVEKVRAKELKSANLQSEMERIQAKEASGLSAGQQAQIHKNEQGLRALADEIEDLDTLINESLSDGKKGAAEARAKRRKKRKQAVEDDEDDLFFDRTEQAAAKRAKRDASAAAGGAAADGKALVTNLWVERHAIVQQLDEERKAFKACDKGKAAADGGSASGEGEGEDALDAFMDDVQAEVTEGSKAAAATRIAEKEAALKALDERLAVLDPMKTACPRAAEERRVALEKAKAMAAKAMGTVMLPPPARASGPSAMPPPPAPGAAAAVAKAKGPSLPPAFADKPAPAAKAPTPAHADSDGFLDPTAARRARAGGLEIRRPPPGAVRKPAEELPDADALIDRLLGGGADSSDDDQPRGGGGEGQDDGTWLAEQERKQTLAEERARKLGY